MPAALAVREVEPRWSLSKKNRPPASRIATRRPAAKSPPLHSGDAARSRCSEQYVEAVSVAREVIEQQASDRMQWALGPSGTTTLKEGCRSEHGAVLPLAKSAAL